MDFKLKFGVAGTGSFTDRVAKMAEDHRIPNEFDSFEKMLELEDLDAVAVCTPNFLHVPMAAAALSAGKAVLSEKPLGLDSVETLRLARRAAALGIGNAVNFTYRSMPPFVLAGEMIRAGEIGELISGSINYCQANWADPSRPLDWRMSAIHSGRGALADLGSHVIDLLLWYGATWSRSPARIQSLPGRVRSMVNRPRCQPPATVPPLFAIWAGAPFCLPSHQAGVGARQPDQHYARGNQGFVTPVP